MPHVEALLELVVALAVWPGTYLISRSCGYVPELNHLGMLGTAACNEQSQPFQSWTNWMQC